MARVCSVCTHPERTRIDHLVATGAAAKRQIAARYGLASSGLQRHEARHLDPRLIEAHNRSLEAEALTAQAVIREVVGDLLEDARACRTSRRLDQYRTVADSLIRANEQFGKITREIGADQVNALFISVGVQNEAELRSRLELTRRIDQPSCEDCLEEVAALWRMAIALAREPRQLQAAGRLLEELRSGTDGASYAQEMEESGNGPSPID